MDRSGTIAEDVDRSVDAILVCGGVVDIEEARLVILGKL